MVHVGMCLQCLLHLSGASTHLPTWWEAVLPHPRAKGVPAAAESIFSCIIYLNTCLTILDRAQSGREESRGHLRTPPQQGCACQRASACGLPLPKVGLTTPGQAGECLQSHVLTRRLSGLRSSVGSRNRLAVLTLSQVGAH